MDYNTVIIIIIKLRTTYEYPHDVIIIVVFVDKYNIMSAMAPHTVGRTHVHVSSDDGLGHFFNQPYQLEILFVVPMCVYIYIIIIVIYARFIQYKSLYYVHILCTSNDFPDEVK